MAADDEYEVLETLRALRISLGIDDTSDEDGIRLGVDGDIYWRIEITPQGEIKTGDGTVPPAALSGTGDLLSANNLSDVANAASALANLGGATSAQGAKADTATQPGDELDTLAATAITDGYVATADGAGGVVWEPAAGGGDLISTNNLSDLTDASAARTNLSLGSAAVENTSAFDAAGSAAAAQAASDPAGSAAAAQAAATQRANHTGTQTASTISDFDTEVANNSAVTANTAKVSNASHTGDVTGATALTIAADAVTYAKMQNVSATDKVLGRATAGAGDVEEITVTAAGRALIDDADAPAQRTTLGLVIGTNVQAFDADTLKADVADTITAGFDSSDFAAGTKSSGTYTPAASDGNFQVATNGGAHTLAPPSTSCSIIIHYTNNGSAGAITTSGFTVVNGDAFTTTDTHEFIAQVVKINDVSTLTVTALQ